MVTKAKDAKHRKSLIPVFKIKLSAKFKDSLILLVLRNVRKEGDKSGIAKDINKLYQNVANPMRTKNRAIFAISYFRELGE